MKPTLTVNLGFRWDVQGDMSEANNLTSDLDPKAPGNIGVAGSGPLGTFKVGNPAIKSNPFNLGPRFGFAWNPRNGNLVVRGGYGLYYDSFDFTALTFGRSVPPLNYNATLAGSAISGQNSFDNKSGQQQHEEQNRHLRLSLIISMMTERRNRGH